MILKSVTVAGVMYCVKLSPDGAQMVVETEDGSGEATMENLIFTTPLQATQLASALVEAAVRWRTLR